MNLKRILHRPVNPQHDQNKALCRKFQAKLVSCNKETQFVHRGYVKNACYHGPEVCIPSLLLLNITILSAINMHVVSFAQRPHTLNTAL